MAKKAVFKKERCDRSPACPVARVCPAGAVTMTRKGFFQAEITYTASKCIGCGKCIRVCPHAAFQL